MRRGTSDPVDLRDSRALSLMVCMNRVAHEWSGSHVGFFLFDSTTEVPVSLIGTARSRTSFTVLGNMVTYG